MAYTAPGRVVGLSFDLGADRALFGKQYDALFKEKKIGIVPYKKSLFNPSTEPAKFKAEVLGQWDNELDIQVFELPQPIQMDSNRVFGNSELWSKAMVLLGRVVEDETVRSCVLDTVTLARRIKADAYLQELQEKQLVGNKDESKLRKQLIQIEWGHPNDTIRTIYTMFKGINKNLVTVHHLTDERVDTPNRDGIIESRLTGKRVINEGSVDPERLWDVGIQTYKTGANITAKYVKCGFNLDLEGTPLAGMEWNMMINQIHGSLGMRPELERVLERAK